MNEFGLRGIVRNNYGIVFGPRFLDGFHYPFIGNIGFYIQGVDYFSISPFQDFM